MNELALRVALEHKARTEKSNAKFAADLQLKMDKLTGKVESLKDKLKTLRAQVRGTTRSSKKRDKDAADNSGNQIIQWLCHFCDKITELF
jgi:hypothetical protein